MKKYKIAIVFSGDPYHPKGLFNAALNRAKHLRQIPFYEVDVFCLASYENAFVRWLRNSSSDTVNRQSIITVGDVAVNVWWYPFSIIDYILSVKLKYRQLFFQKILSKKSKDLKDYNLISAHSYDAGIVAYEAYKKFGIPFTVTWHGSDIHTLPWISKSVMKGTIKLTENAKANFYVSKALQKLSEKIVQTDNKYISYNGVDNRFIRYSDDKIDEIKFGLGVSGDKKIVSFIGGIIEIKNAQLLPDIFRMVHEKYREQVEFWIIGNGKLKSLIKEKFDLQSNIFYRFFGDVSTEYVISLMNCTDVLILPSKNEGLPLVIVEAYKCGTKVVTSDVGGCIEVVGKDNVIKHDKYFLEKFSDRVVQLLNSEDIPELDERFNWDRTIELETSIFEKIIKTT